MLMCGTRETLENAGETNWRGKNVGCFIGAFGEDWLETRLRDTHETGGMYRISGMADYVLANRISYEFDFKGPRYEQTENRRKLPLESARANVSGSLVVKTGCSSSLVGLHMACNALRNGDCTSAIVAGSNLIMTPTMTIVMTEQVSRSPLQ